MLSKSSTGFRPAKAVSHLPRRRAVIVTSAALAVGVFASGCAATGATAPTSVGEPTAGGSLVIGTSMDPTCIDPTQITSLPSLNVTHQIVDSLTDQDPATGEIVPWLADSWEISPDGLTYTFTLHEGVTFSDDTAFTAQTVKDNLDAIVALGAKAPSASGYLATYTGAEVLDTHTIALNFSAPSAQFLQATATATFGMVSSATAAKSAEARCADGVVGSGPFVLESYTANESVVLTKRTGYNWAPETRAHNGEAYLDQVTFQILPEASVRSGSVLSDNVQLIDEVPDSSVDSIEASGLQLITKPRPGLVTSLIFNQASSIGSDAAVRQAIMLATNRADLVTVAGIQGSAATGYLPLTEQGALDLSSKLAVDIDGAEEILDDAGWIAGADGVRTRDGSRLTIATPIFFGAPEVELLQQQLADIGIELVVQSFAYPDYIAKVLAGDFDATVTNWARSDANALQSIVATRYSNSDAALLALFDQQNQATDPSARAEIVKDIQQVLFDEAYAVPLWALEATFAASPKLHGITLDGSTQLVLIDAWLSTE